LLSAACLSSGNARLRHAPGIACPTLGQEEPQPHHHRNLARRQSERDQRLAIGGLSKGGGVLRRDADRVRALLRQGRIVDDQPSVGAADHPVSFDKESLFQRRGVPDSAGDEVMKLVVSDIAVARRHGLDALAIPRADEPRHIGRAHPRPRLVSKSADKRRQPPFEIGLPAVVHGRPSKTPTTHESRKRIRGNPKKAGTLKNLPK
jgi:hypothetical protein